MDVLGCQIYRLLALPYRCSRSDTSAPPGDTPHPTSYTLGWHLLPAVVLSAPAVGSRLFNFPGPQAVPLEERCTQENVAARPVVTGRIFEGGDTFFQKCLLAYLKGPVLLYLYNTAGGPKSK